MLFCPEYYNGNKKETLFCIISVAEGITDYALSTNTDLIVIGYDYVAWLPLEC
jgi:hypothetical protein